MRRIFTLPEMNLVAETGKFARQADGAVWIKAGNNVVLVTAVANKYPQEFKGFFPLTVEYRERLAAVGRIPGGFVKREGRLSDIEILTSRLIDRPIRPLFPSTYFNDVQLLCTVYSSDGKFPVSILSIIGSSLALSISDIPFLGPIGAIQANRIDGKWVFNAEYEEITKSDSEIMIVGTEHGVCMVEGSCNNVLESELEGLLLSALKEIRIQIRWQQEIQNEIGAVKHSLESTIDWNGWKRKVEESLPKHYIDSLFASSRKDIRIAFEKLTQGLLEKFKTEINQEPYLTSVILYLLDSIFKDELPKNFIKRGKRLDDRKFDEIRSIYSEVAIIPCSHGSAVFQRGETQALASITLGTAQDAQKFETLMGGVEERFFMLHYNFPPFSTGEVKPIRGAGRREIGHGYLAEFSFLNVLPTQKEFPYTIRVVTDILGSNGSSSMATVCSSSLALMDAGVPIKSPVAGIAMGAIRDESSGKVHILTDITGKEDGYGLMDFKVAGTAKGIMSFQLDIKDKNGLSGEVLREVLERAKIARLFILQEMSKTIAEPRKKLSDLAPRVITFTVSTDKIGAIIGPAGKVIKDIVMKTGTQVDVSDTGEIRIYSKDRAAAVKAENWIRVISGEVRVGDLFAGIIKRITDFGIFVELVPGREGLVHISTIAKSKQRDLNRRYKVNDQLRVKIASYDREMDRIRLIAPDLEKDYRREE